MKIYTRTGDEGQTKLYGGARVLKDDPRVAAYGTLDELNAAIGSALALDPESRLGLDGLREVQEDLFVLGSRLAAADPERMEEQGSIPRLAPSGRALDHVPALGAAGAPARSASLREPPVGSSVHTGQGRQCPGRPSRGSVASHAGEAVRGFQHS